MRYYLIYFSVTVLLASGLLIYFRSEAQASPLMCSLETSPSMFGLAQNASGQVSCDFIENNIVIYDVILNRGNCMSAYALAKEYAEVQLEWARRQFGLHPPNDVWAKLIFEWQTTVKNDSLNFKGNFGDKKSHILSL